MHYVAVVGGKEIEVEVTELSPHRFQVVIDGRRLETDVRSISQKSLSLLLGNEVFDAAFETHPDGGDNVLVRGTELRVEMLDLRKMRIRRAKDAADGPDGPVEIASPMPGKIVAVLVKPGDEVSEGQGLLVVEAMKMENELRAPRDGIVKKVAAQPGAAVDGGVTLCVIA